jgi:hypothetical protein
MDYMLLLSNAAESNEPSPGPLPHTNLPGAPAAAHAADDGGNALTERQILQDPQPLPGAGAAPGEASITSTCPE